MSCTASPNLEIRNDLMTQEEIAQTWSLDEKWWIFYKDADLDALIKKTLDRNIDLAKSAIAVNRALYNARLIGADLLPGFSAEVSTGPERNLKTGDVGHSYQSRFGITYELDLWKKLHNAASAQEWEYLATQEDLASTRLALLNSVIDCYFDLRYMNEAIRLTQGNIERYQYLLSLTKTRHDLGKVTAVEPLQAEQSLLSARNSLYNLENQRKSSEQTLRDLLDSRPSEVFHIRNTDLLKTPEATLDMDIPVAALAARPDIRAAEDRLQKAFKTVQSNRVSWYPSISLGSTLHTNANEVDRFFDIPFLGGSVQISFPFLQWKTIHWQIKISEADFDIARFSFTSAVTTALNELDAALFHLYKSRQTLINMLEKHKKDVEICEYYQNRYDLGAGELKDYLEAQNTADSSLLSALEAKYTSIKAENLIFRAMGGKYMLK